MPCGIACQTAQEHPELAAAYDLHPTEHLTQDVIGSNVLTYADAACIAQARNL